MPSDGGTRQHNPKCVHYPFDGGSRVCTGNTFALLDVTILLATAGQR